MTKQEKAELRRSYEESYHKTTGEHIRVVPCSEWSAVVTFVERVDFWKLVKVVFDLTGWTKSGTFGKGRAEERIFRRGLIDFIAIYNGCSYSQCARLTGRDHTTVLNSVRKFEDRLGTDSHTRSLLKETADYIKENYYIYENQNISISDL